MPGKLLFVSGLSGSGKTTLGELLKKEDGWAHFNVDVWAFGGDPLEESGAVPGPAMMAKRDPLVKEAFDGMIANGFRKLAAGEPVDPNVWLTFFALLCPAVVAARQQIGDQDLVVSFSVYLRTVRDYLRQQLEGVGFVVLDPSIGSVAERKVAHLRDTAAARGQTLSQFLRSFNPSSDAPELEEAVIVGMLTEQAQAAANGFEPAAADEPRTLAVGDLSAEEVHRAVRAFLPSL